ncbi:HNH endonuclease [Desmospora activa]|uniref:HNH endonuclease n=1 Tax=Desmospora activa DSM 45169 TaxID=1121389 RepID=A0A2T4Z463_9BACL|nr:HNH endonuclease [Desmospora activa]PTM56679.1 HNH endonuclease [Desmospora activa DSM 45169]
MLFSHSHITEDDARKVWWEEDGRCENCKRPMGFSVSCYSRIQKNNDYTADNLYLFCPDCKKHQPDFLDHLLGAESDVIKVLAEDVKITEAEQFLIKNLQKHGVLLGFSQKKRLYWLPGIGKFSVHKRVEDRKLEGTDIVYPAVTGSWVAKIEGSLAAEWHIRIKPQERSRKLPHPQRVVLSSSPQTPIECIMKAIRSSYPLPFTFNIDLLTQEHEITMIFKDGGSYKQVDKETAIYAVQKGISKIVSEYPTVIVNRVKCPRLKPNSNKSNRKKPNPKKKQNSYQRIRQKVLLRDEYTCRYCGRYGNTVDHIIPRAKGGKNKMENLVACCFDCNQAKKDLLPEVFAKVAVTR